MKLAVISFLMKFLDLDSICTMLARCIAFVLSYASKRGGKSWDIAKDVIVKTNMWTSLFVQVYDDEKLSADEEKIIADAIKHQTSIEKAVDILKNSISSSENKV